MYLKSLTILLLSFQCINAKLLATTDHVLEVVTISPGENEVMIACIAQCHEVFAEYAPSSEEIIAPMTICGSDGRTYLDREHFLCALHCGRDILMSHFGPCCTSTNGERYISI